MPSSYPGQVEHNTRAKSFFNPVLTVNQTLGDPHVIRTTRKDVYGNPITTFYMYTTAHWGIGCYSSHDLVNWTAVGTSGPNQWCYDQLYDQRCLGTHFFWAPAITETANGEFVMFVSSTMDEKDGFNDARLRVAKSCRPDGGFKFVNTLVTDRAFIDPFYMQVIDSQCNTRHFLYFATMADFDVPKEHGPAGIYAAELSDDLSRFISAPMYLFGPNTHPESWVTQGVNEAPWVLQLSATDFIMVYSGNLFNASNYGLGYAVSTTGPLGPYRKAVENPILKNAAGVVSPGHNSFVTDDEGQLWCVYHVDNPDASKKEARMVALDRAHVWHENRQFGIAIRGPTVGKQQAPKIVC